MKTIHKLARPELPEASKLKVAAYARVSTSSNEQLASLQTQITHYENHIKNHEQWDYVGVYYDEGISGTKTVKRDGLKRLIKDAELGKIDLILTKSISRFSRNTVDCLNLVRQLTDIGVTIFFEKENINTGDMESELLLSILSSLAESESYSHSENLKWAIRNRMSKGKFKAYPPYGYKRKGYDFHIVAAEAKVVKQMFQWALDGISTGMIAKRLNDGKQFTKRGANWQATSVRSILKNEVYTGTLTMQQTFVDDQYKRRINKGELPMYQIKNNHEPIVSKEDYDRVQELIRRKAEAKGNTGDGKKYTKRYAFSGNIICDKCGSKFKRVHTYWKGNTKKVQWKCTGHLKNKDSCNALPITDEDLKVAYLTMLNKLIFGHKLVLEPFMKSLNKAGANQEGLEVLADEIDKIQEKLEVLASLTASSILSTKVSLEEQSKLQQERAVAQEKQRLIIESVNGKSTQQIELEALYKFARMAEMLTDWDEDLFKKFTNSITVYNRQEVGFELKCGLLLKERLPE
ncbi:TPA: recombinase family protein [Enterococcus faecium]